MSKESPRTRAPWETEPQGCVGKAGEGHFITGMNPVQPNQVKDTNPKDVLASDKLPLGVVPDTVIAYATLAWTEGMLKYGRYNWRIAGVRASVYHDAMQRHRIKYWNGEWADPKTGVPHLASIIACAGILLEAHLIQNITDDRPPVNANLVALVDALESQVKHLKEMFKDKHPHQYTIIDSPKPDPRKEL